MDDEVEWDETYGSTLLAEFKGLAANQKAESDGISSRARGSFALVAGFFAVAQTAALSGFHASALSKHEQHVILHWAIGSAVGLGITAVLVVLTTSFRKYPAVGQADVEKATETAVAENADFSVVLAKRYQKQVINGETKLVPRRRLLIATQTMAVASLVAITAEIIQALSGRL